MIIQMKCRVTSYKLPRLCDITTQTSGFSLDEMSIASSISLQKMTSGFLFIRQAISRDQHQVSCPWSVTSGVSSDKLFVACDITYDVTICYYMLLYATLQMTLVT